MRHRAPALLLASRPFEEDVIGGRLLSARIAHAARLAKRLFG